MRPAAKGRTSAVIRSAMVAPLLLAMAALLAPTLSRASTASPETRVWGSELEGTSRVGVEAFQGREPHQESSARGYERAVGFLVVPKPGAVVYRELSAADRAALEAGKPLQPRGTGGTVLEHVRGQPTGHISASTTIEGTSRFSGGHGLAEIQVEKAGSRLVPHGEVVKAVGPRPKQVLKVEEAGEVLFEGPIDPRAVRIIDRVEGK